MNFFDTIEKYKNDGKRVAHIYRENIITYGELLRKSDLLADYLIHKFGRDKTPIVVLGHKQNEMLICFLACIKAGHAYIPVDSGMAGNRIKDIIQSSNTKCVLDIEDIQLDDIDNEIQIGINEILDIINETKTIEIDTSYRVSDNDVFYIIYTSGSTGKPKGVQITLSCLQSFLKWTHKICKLDKDRNYIFLNQAPFAFDLSVMDLYTSLTTGSTLYSVDKEMISNMNELFKYLKKSNINIWVSTPSFAEMCLADSSFNNELLNNIEIMLFCGETLTNTCVTKLHERFHNVKVYNTYGPTETTVAITQILVDENLNNKYNPLPVGKPKDDCKLLIVDTNGNELNEGEKGEIVICGESVSIGYYNNPEMTAKSFLTKIVNGASMRCYRTGDEGYIKEGLLYYCGRIDFQIKLNGYRIELEDIENNMNKVEFINRAVILPIKKDGKIDYLAAIVSLNRRIEEKDFKMALIIKNELKKLIPEYMIPRKIIIKDALPVTNNGKVDRKLLEGELM